MSHQFIWDKVVRLTHWSVAIIVIANFFITEEGESLHQYLGYTAVGLVTVRLLWAATLASYPARLRDLTPTLAGFTRHWQEIKSRQATQSTGHNAFGLLAVWLMWGCIIGLGVTGYVSETDWGIMNDVSEWHELIATILQATVFLHIIAVFLTGWWLKYNLVKTMTRNTR